MHVRHFSFAALVALLTLVATPAIAQVPRTPWGTPDLRLPPARRRVAAAQRPHHPGGPHIRTSPTRGR